MEVIESCEKKLQKLALYMTHSVKKVRHPRSTHSLSELLNILALTYLTIFKNNVESAMPYNFVFVYYESKPLMSSQQYQQIIFLIGRISNGFDVAQPHKRSYWTYKQHISCLLA